MNHREDLMKDRFPQPHIDRFTCYGGYRGMLQDLALRRDYIGVLSTLVTSSSYINWTDSTVVEWMMEMLNDSLDEEWKEDFYHELSGNYDGSYVQFRIHTSKDKMSFKINCTREEYEKIQKKYGDCLGIDGRQVVKELLKG